MRAHVVRSALVILCLVAGMHQAVPSRAQEEGSELHSQVEAPPDTRSLGSTLGGAYFVDQQLLDRYDAQKAQLARIREDIVSGRASGDQAMQSLDAIEIQMRQLQDELQKARVQVSAFQVYSQTTEQTFPLGEDRLILITGDNVTVRGWQGPGVKCVVEKVILAKERPDDSQFDAIQVNHEVTVPEDKVGTTRQRRDEQEQQFLESDEGRKLTDGQKADRKAFVDQIHNSYNIYSAFQGRQVNTIQLNGLTYQEGNRNLLMEITSPGGGGMSASQWQRHATITVYVPPCEALAVRGCLVGLDIEDIECDLILTTRDSRDRKYDGRFSVRGVKGNVVIDQVPVRELADIAGNVRFLATDEFVNSGTVHENNLRTFSPYDTQQTRIDCIEGDLQADFLRTDLQLSEIRGKVDVVNQFGSTRWDVGAVETERAHRVVSQCGSIHLEGSAEILSKTPIYAYTQCGRLHTNLPQSTLEEISFSSGDPRRGWHGFVTPSEDRFEWGRFERPVEAMENRDRTSGIDLISHAGSVSIEATLSRQ